MSKIKGLAWVISAALLASAGASAQQPPDTRLPLPADLGTRNNDAIRVMNEFARCVGWRREQQAVAVLAMPLRSQEQNAAANALVTQELVNDCIREEEATLAAPPTLLVGGMAEELVLRRFARIDPSRIAALSAEEQARIGLRPRNAYEDLALCIVQRDGAGVRALLDTRPASPPEVEAINRLVPHLTACVTAGQTMQFSRPALRGLVAAGLYRALSLMAGQRTEASAARN